MKTYQMHVSKKEAGEYKPVGVVVVPMFALNEFGITCATELDAEQRAAAVKALEISAEDDDGLDYYADARIQFVYDAVVSATKADARNKLVSGSSALKPGNKIADTVEELIAKAERSGAALALNREFLTSFSAYLAAKSGKSAVVQALYNGMTKVRATITLSSQARKDGLLAQLEGYIGQATTEDVAKFSNIITTLGDLCSSAEAIGDDEVL